MVLKISAESKTTSLGEVVRCLQENSSPLSSVEELVCLLQRCGKEEDLANALRLHAYMRESGLEGHPVLGNALVMMLVEVGSIQSAQAVFDNLLGKHEWAWNSLISGHVKFGKAQSALSLYQSMLIDGSVLPSGYTFVAILRACSSLKNLQLGHRIHALAAQSGCLDGNLFVANAVIDMYAKCGSLERAQKVFDNLSIRDVVSWNSLIAGYMEHGQTQEAILFIDKMHQEGVSPSAVTFVSSLKACGYLKAMSKLHELHADIERKGLLQRNLLVATILVDMYAKCGLLDSAHCMFMHLPVQDAVSWTALIARYVDHGRGEEAVSLFEKMQSEGIFPDMVAFLSSVKACGNIGATEKGVDIHIEIERRGLLEKDVAIGTALVDMYGKCGLLSKAQQVFDRLQVHDVISCNALMTGYAQIGESDNVSSVFSRMSQENIKPDPVTFIVVLAACTRGGFFHSSESFIDAMTKNHGIAPSLEHLACMIDLFSRAGQLDKAVELMKKLHGRPNLVVWHSILGACKKWGILDFGKDAFEHAVLLDKADGSAYVLMSHIYAASALQD